jgi:hypothetical protein
MGKKVLAPRYNVLSCRVSDDLKQSIKRYKGKQSVQQFIHTAIEEKLISDRQARFDSFMAMLKRAANEA